MRFMTRIVLAGVLALSSLLNAQTAEPGNRLGQSGSSSLE